MLLFMLTLYQSLHMQSYNKLYVYIVEEKLAESLTSFKHVQDQEFIRRTNTKYGQSASSGSMNILFLLPFSVIHLENQGSKYCHCQIYYRLCVNLFYVDLR